MTTYNSLQVLDTATTTGSATGNPRNKVALKKGHSIMDWVRLGHTTPDLAGTGGDLLKVTLAELAKHNKRNDAWISLKGKVYNVTPYFDYHPGGEDELMRGVGTDATQLFCEVHKWVNFTTMLEKCHVGTLVEQKSFFSKPIFLPLKKLGKYADSLSESVTSPNAKGRLQIPEEATPGNKSPLISPQSNFPLPAPKYDWFQTKTLINVAIYTKWKDIAKYHVIVINSHESFKVIVYIQAKVFTVHVALHKEVEMKFELKIGSVTGKVDILLRKVEEGVRWPSLGSSMPDNNRLIMSANKEVEFIECKIKEKRKINHNIYLYTFLIPAHIHMMVPIGFHVYIRIPGSELMKPYTPVISPFHIIKKNEDVEEDNNNLKIFFKVYPDGQLSPQLAGLCEGDHLEVSYPEGTFSFESLKVATVDASFLVLLGAGTGITPLIKLMIEALCNEVKTILVTFNQTKDDIPWQIELDSLVVTHSKFLRVFHVLSAPSESWSGRTGRVRKSLLNELIPVSDGEKPCYICICGPSGFTNLTIDLLRELGYTNDDMFAFTG